MIKKYKLFLDILVTTNFAAGTIVSAGLFITDQYLASICILLNLILLELVQIATGIKNKNEPTNSTN